MATAPILSERVFTYLEKTGAATNAQIAAGLKVAPNTIAARTWQMYQGGSLSREERENEPLLYTIQDRAGRTSKKPKRKRRSRAKVDQVMLPAQDNPFAVAVQALADALADLIIAQVGRSIASKASGMLIAEQSKVVEASH